MVRCTLSSRAALVAAILLSPSPHAWAESPSDLVRAALQTELVGPSPRREQLLTEALRSDPDFAPARWLSGYLKWNDRWLSVAEAPQHFQDDPRRAEYRRRRLLQDSAATNHRQLAKWCAAQGLLEEARLHWTKVLQLGHDDEARAALALTNYQGQLLTPEQIQQQQEKRETQWLATQAWNATVSSWRDDLLRGSRSEAAAARAEMAELSDPNAIRPLQKLFLGPKKPGQLSRLFVETVGHVNGPEATKALLQVASWHPSGGIRTAALVELKKRPKYAVVPLLLASLEYTAQSSYRIYFALDGSVVRNQRTVLRGWHDDYVIRQRHEVRGRAAPLDPGRAERIAQELATEAQQTQQQIAQRAALSLRSSARHKMLLAQVMDMEPENDSVIWYRRWLADREYDLPKYQPRRTYEQLYRTTEYSKSCFPAGTTVATLRGERGIETIRVGDRVLAQDVNSGEIAYKLVHNVTLRAPSPMIKIRLDGEALRATRGHPFWVNGRTWLMAKELEAAMVLHGLGGAVVVESVESAPSASAYNLVVGDYNTYFVGQQRVLVHDNMPPAEPSARIPGWLGAGAH